MTTADPELEAIAAAEAGGLRTAAPQGRWRVVEDWHFTGDPAQSQEQSKVIEHSVSGERLTFHRTAPAGGS